MQEMVSNPLKSFGEFNYIHVDTFFVTKKFNGTCTEIQRMLSSNVMRDQLH